MEAHDFGIRVKKRREATVKSVQRACQNCQQAGCALSGSSEPLASCQERGCGMWPYGRGVEAATYDRKQ